MLCGHQGALKVWSGGWLCVRAVFTGELIRLPLPTTNAPASAEQPMNQEREPETKSGLVERDRSHLIHPLHNSTQQASEHVWVKGEGAVLTDADGKQYLDGLAGLWNVTAGHGRRELAEAAAKQMQTLAYCSGYAGSSNPRAIELSERLAGITYPSIHRFFFTSG